MVMELELCQLTAAGTEGQILQAGSGGVPEYGGIDGGTY